MNYRYAACYVAIRNDFCLEESIVALLEQGVEHVLILSPETYWSNDEPQEQGDFDELAEIAKRTGSELATAKLKSTKEEYTALHTEALYRNYGACMLIETTKADYILVVDADEFWMPGTLKHVDTVLRDKPDLKVTLPGIPVAGFPGLPIEGAKDAILAAHARGLQFEWGRTMPKGTTIEGSQPVIHFSATRRKPEEIADKMRMSAHYGDSNYDFDGWIKDTLPNIRVGMKDVHMYQSEDNIWPRVRAWTPEEMTAIPATLHPYLSSEIA